ncbi:MAG: prolipoprotein diacylglyceryl transferase [Myxococcales bacterium]
MRAGGPGGGPIGNFINGELWGRAPTRRCRGRWSSRSRAADCRAIRRSSTSSCSRGCCCSRCCGSTRASRARPGMVSGWFLVGYGVCASSAEYFREPDAFLGLLALNISMGQWLCVPMVLAGFAIIGWARRQPEPPVAA